MKSSFLAFLYSTLFEGPYLNHNRSKNYEIICCLLILKYSMKHINILKNEIDRAGLRSVDRSLFSRFDRIGQPSLSGYLARLIKIKAISNILKKNLLRIFAKWALIIYFGFLISFILKFHTCPVSVLINKCYFLA